MVARVSPKLDLECRGCGYGVVTRVAPDRCPMCQGTDLWVHALWRPFHGVTSGRRPRL